MYLLNARQHNALETGLLEITEPGLLMELAGVAVIREIKRRALTTPVFGNRRHVLVLCGPGNNGGDGWVIARRLHAEGVLVEVWSFVRRTDLTGDARRASDRAIDAGVSLTEITDETVFEDTIDALPHSKESPDDLEPSRLLIIDALLGAGVNRPVEGILAHAVRFCHQCNNPFQAGPDIHPGYVIAVDIPTGLSADSAAAPIVVNADLTVALLSVRLAHVVQPAANYIGELEFYELFDAFEFSDSEEHDEDDKWQLGFDSYPIYSGEIPEMSPVLDMHAETKIRIHPSWRHSALDFRSDIERAEDMHKGMAGRVVIVAGSAGKMGAAQLAGLAALRAGAGLVTLAVPADCVSQVTHVPDYMTLALPSQNGMVTGDGVDDIFTLRPDVIALGPGLGVGDGPRTLIEQVLTRVRNTEIRVVLDADGLNVFAGQRSQALRGYGGDTLIITPHPGELSQLTGQSVAAIQADRVTAARDCARDLNLSVVLKGFQTVSAWHRENMDPEFQIDSPVLAVNMTGNPGLATGGTGDVLTGIIAAMLARKDPFVPQCLRRSVFLHGYVGDLAAEEVGQTSLIASDLIRLLPRGIKELAAGMLSVAPSHNADKIIHRDSRDLRELLDS
jgi:hydroxyethylthiazole kinase-like uncharacterized protein yjeF